MTRLSLALAWTLSLSVPSFAAPVQSDLHVKVTGSQHSRGQVILLVFCEGQDVLKPELACIRVGGGIEAGQSELTVVGLEHGRYAVTVFHDENGNGILDHRLGFPAEPLGFSGGFRLRLFSGFPSFKKLQFVFGGEGLRIALNGADD